MEAKHAFELSSNLPHEDRLLIEGRYHEISKDWEKAVGIYRALFEFFPDSLDYGLALANAQTSGGRGSEAIGDRRSPEEVCRIHLETTLASISWKAAQQNHWEIFGVT